MSMKTAIQNFARDLKTTMHNTESFLDLLERYLPKFVDESGENCAKYDKIADITTTAQPWTPNNDKYSYYLIVINISGYVVTEILPKDKVGSLMVVSCWLNSDYNAGFNLNTSTTGLKYTVSKVGFGSVQSAEIRGVY